jgi:MFS family permease
MFGPVAARIRRSGALARRQLVVAVGGPARTRVVVLLACVLALASADTATVGASAVELRRGLHIDNTDIGLLISVTSLIAAVFSLPLGVMVDRARRTWLLAFALLTWGGVMLWSAAAASFGQLLLSRLALGAVTAASGPVVASLVGDWFPASERSRIYGFILTGELLGAGAGFAITGDIAALSWRAAFVILALPAFILCWLFFRLPEPARGGQDTLSIEQGSAEAQAGSGADLGNGQAGNGHGQGGTAPGGRTGAAGIPPHAPDPQQMARDRGIRPDPRLLARARQRMTFGQAFRYVMSVRTNVALIISSACGYYFLSGVQAFGTEFVSGQYHVGQVLANLLLLVVGAGAVGGVLASGQVADTLLRRGRMNARIMTAAVAAAATVLLFIPVLTTHSALTAIPYVVVAAACLSAQNPPIDSARLDIMPPWLWGRAEGVRTFLRTAAQALAPVLFGVFSDHLFGGGTSGLKWTFVIMLLPLAGSAFYLFRARQFYPADVAATAVLNERAARRAAGAAG